MIKDKKIKKAFSMAELIIVIGIIGVVSLIAISNLSNTSGDKDLVAQTANMSYTHCKCI